MRVLCSVILLCLCCALSAQEYNYVHYSEQDGLAGSTVYDMCQDKDGFMWFATESGLSRYDGTRFTNFTTKDGLPDNEVLRVFADSKGRVWIGTLNKELSYYYKGKVYNNRNTPWLKKATLSKFLASIIETGDSTVMFCDGKDVYALGHQDSIYKIEGRIFGDNAILTITTNRFGNAFVVNANTMNYYTYNAKQKNFSFLGTYPKAEGKLKSQEKPATRLMYDLDGMGKILHKLQVIPDATRIDLGIDNTYWFNTSDGAWRIDTLSNEKAKQFLPGKIISRTAIDTERNMWFATLGEGVYKLISLSFTTYSTLGKNITRGNEVYSLNAYENGIIAGVGFSKAVLLKNEKIATIFNGEKQWTQSFNPYKNNRLYCITPVGKNKLIFGFDAFLAKLDNGKTYFNHIFPIKSVEVIDSNYVVVGTANNAFKIRVNDFVITDTIWKERSSEVFYHDNKYYIGTVNGLYEVNEDKSSTYLGTLHYALSRRIVDIKKDDNGTLWIATNDAGIVAYKNGKILHEVNESKGLASDICKTLFWQRPFLWAGTNKGLSKINTGQPGLPTISYSMADGLASNFINAIYVKADTVYVGTPAGITVFNENAVMATSACNLNMLAVTTGGRDTAVLGNYDLSWRGNGIGFEYIAVSFKSAGDITYRYMLQGLDTAWLQTRNTNINYPSLPAGEYTLLLEAVNKFGVKSNTLQVRFTIDAPLWKKWWFYLLVSLLAVSLILWVMQGRNKKARGRLEEKNKMQRQLAELEQQALQSQMNPHFIFNCLNSIQQFIVLVDIQAANKYLTAFARLIRQTLDNSAKKTLSIEEELTYLSSYLELEKMRFGGRFIYTITVDDNIDKYDDWIPAMLVQPFVENSIRHGLAEKKEQEGLLKVSFKKESNNIICTITDNGIGRQASAKRKSAAHIEYQSKGMSLTQKRIDLINQNNQSHIQLTITDLYHPGTGNANEAAVAAGTTVTLIIPQ